LGGAAPARAPRAFRVVFCSRRASVRKPPLRGGGETARAAELTV